MLKRRLVTFGIAVSGLAVAVAVMLFGAPGRLEYHAFAELYHQGTPTVGNALHMAIDCDVLMAGTQSDCLFVTYSPVPGNFNLDIGVTVGYSSGPGAAVAAFNFDVATDKTVLLPLAGVDGDLNSNPDANEGALGAGWTCADPPPQPDTGLYPAPLADSFLACAASPVTGAVTVPADGTHIRLATVHYYVDWPPYEPSWPHVRHVSLQLFNVAAADDNAITLLECPSLTMPPVRPVIGPDDSCFSANLKFESFWEPPPPPVTNTFTATPAPTATATPTPPITADAVGGVAKPIDTEVLPSPAPTVPGDRRSGYVNAGIAVMAAVVAAGGVWAAWRWVKPGE
jgi:hypothetical protein